MPEPILSRRGFLGSCGALGTAALARAARASDPTAAARSYHLSISPQAIGDDPEGTIMLHSMAPRVIRLVRSISP